MPRESQYRYNVRLGIGKLHLAETYAEDGEPGTAGVVAREAAELFTKALVARNKLMEKAMAKAAPAINDSGPKRKRAGK